MLPCQNHTTGTKWGGQALLGWCQVGQAVGHNSGEPVAEDNSFSIHYLQLEDTIFFDLKTQVTFKGRRMTIKECLFNLGSLS
jgi:hypothetical protein